MVDRFEHFSGAIVKISRAWRKLACEEMAKHGLRGPHATYLITIDRFQQGITVPQICFLTGKDKSDASRMIGILEDGWNTLFKALHNLSGEDLLKKVYIRAESLVVIDAIERQLAHYAYHIGQIVYIGKQIKSEDWESLSIPKGQSDAYLQQMLKKHQS